MIKNGMKNFSKFINERRSGNAVLMLLPFLLFMLIFGYSMISRSTSEHTQSFRVHRQNVVSYLAEGVLNLAMEYINTKINEDPKMKTDFLENTIKMVNLYEKYPDIRKNVDFLISEMPGSKFGRLTMDFVDVVKFPGSSDKVEKAGTLVFTCAMSYYDVDTTLKITRDIKIVNITPPAQDFTLYTNAYMKEFEINDGPIITCLNKDKDSGKVGSIRLASDSTHPVSAYIGELYGWASTLINSLPPNTSPLPLPLLHTELKLMLIPNPVQNNWTYVYGGYPRKFDGQTGLGSFNTDSRTKGKLRLFGLYNKSITGRKSNICLPEKLYGFVQKIYGKYSVKCTLFSPGTTNTPPLYIHTIIQPPAKIVEPYVPAGAGVFYKLEPDLPMKTAAYDANYYKMRALYFSSELKYNDMKVFENGDAFNINGILFTNNAEIGTESQEFNYKGRGVIFSDNAMCINNNVNIKKDKDKKSSNLSLILYPKSVNALMYKRHKKNDNSGVQTILVYANIFSFNSLQFFTTGNNSSASMTTVFRIFGNLSVENLNPGKFFTNLEISYQKRLDDRKNEQYVVSMSPIYSSWFEEKKGK